MATNQFDEMTMFNPQSLTGRRFAEAHQDMIDNYSAVNRLVRADWVIFDVDDTLLEHDPDSQYWLALHTLAVQHGKDGQFEPHQFVRNYELAKQHPTESGNTELQTYLTAVRRLSEAHTGDAYHFEAVAQAFRDSPDDGERLKVAIKTIQAYSSTGPFWEKRAQLLHADGVPSAFGLSLSPGMQDLLAQLNVMSKRLAIISNSRADLILPALDDLLPKGRYTFNGIIALGGTDTPIKPARDGYEVLSTLHNDASPCNSVYIGNSREDMEFAENVGMPVVIMGANRVDTDHVSFVDNASVLAQVLRKHVDAASLSRLMIRGESDWPDTTNEALRYSATPEQVGHMISARLRRLWRGQLERSLEAYSSNVWSDQYPSLRNITNFSNMFGPFIGDIRVARLSTHPALLDYFTEERTHRENGTISLRGERYFTCVDPRLSREERINVMVSELYQAVKTVHAIRREELTPDDLPSYLGILDNAKQQALSIFHAYTYNERQEGIAKDSSYLQLRAQLQGVASNLTRSFFEACLGREFSDLPSLESVGSVVAKFQNVADTINPTGFKHQDFDHPLKVMLTAYGLARKPQPAETIISFPSGGTQLAIATALATEVLHTLPPHSINLVSIPLSQHSGTVKRARIPIVDKLLAASVELFATSIRHKHVTIVDDNSSTGSTMERGTRAVEQLSPVSITHGVGEIDPKRMLLRANHAIATDSIEVANLYNELFDNASGVLPITSRDIQVRKEVAGRILGVPSWRRNDQ